MTDNVRELKEAPNDTVISILESLLVDAKSGKIQSIAVCGIYSDCVSFNCFEANYQAVKLLGEVRILERDIIDLNIEIRRKVAWDFTE